MLRNQSLSVVIPTLGGESLRATIMQLNRGTFMPTEILVCIPEREAPLVQNLGIPGVRVVVTEVRGQVAQRARGFQEAVGAMVLQIDDDIQVEPDCLGRIVRALEQAGPGNAVGPVYIDANTGECVHRINGGFKGWLQSVYAMIVCGAPWAVARMGRSTSIGVSYGVDCDHCGGKSSVETDWLPGGCVISFRGDLVLDSFFPFPGKAYCEDNIHSLLRKGKGIRHWVVPDARCAIEVPKSDFPDAAWRGSTVARRYCTQLSHGSRWRAEIYSALLRLHWFLLHSWGRTIKPSGR
jgi:glycosyltransferase involved in cell wall biosynthesis